jgi:hypothetical protein
MLRDFNGFECAAIVALCFAGGCTSSDSRMGPGEPGASAAGSASDPASNSQPAIAYSTLAATVPSSSVRPPLPGRAARTVLDEEVNEAENLFFTDDGRLFVSGGEDIYEFERTPDGRFTKTDHFDEDCRVEGIIQSGQYLYGVCTRNNDLTLSAFLIAGELSAQPVFHTIAPLDAASGPNGMTVDPEGRIYITNSLTQQIVRVTLASPLEVGRTEIWANGLSLVNGIKYLDDAMYVTVLDLTLISRLLRIPLLSDGSAGRPERLYERAFTVLDDILAFERGFIITDFVNGTLIFWDEQRGAYAETPTQTFYGPTSLAQGRPPMFSEGQLVVAEKGTFTVRDEVDGDLLSMYELP